MRYLILFLLAIGFVSCWNQQWEDRMANGDTGSMTHGNSHENEMYNNDTTIDSKTLDGKALFKANCASCHTASTKRTVGPGLCGVCDRIPGGDWKYEFIRNADSLIKSGDAYANALFIKYNKTQHTRFPNLTNEEIDAILAYCSPSHCY